MKKPDLVALMAAQAVIAAELSPFVPRRRELLIGAAVTAAVAGALLLLGPAPGDAPAHLYRTLLVRDGTFVWDNFWYAGDYPLALPLRPAVSRTRYGSAVGFTSLRFQETECSKPPPSNSR